MYQRSVKYYETDKMGITHHSNYIRWMEEARIDYLDHIGYNFDRIEREGIVSPVVSVSGDFKKTTTFPDEIFIEVSIEEFKGVKLKLFYQMKNEAGDIVFEGRSSHCFLNKEGRPVRLNKEYPELYQALIGAMGES